MNKSEAYQEMLNGHRVRNEYYDSKEYAFINKDGEIEFEDGCICSEFDWDKYQDPYHKLEWSIVKEWIDKKEWDQFTKPYLITYPYINIDYQNYLPKPTKKQLNEVVVPVKSSSPIKRNDLCPCNSGLKYKKCCLKI